MKKAPSYSTTRVVEALSCLTRTEAEHECFSALLIVSSGPPSFRALTVAAMVTQHLPSSQSKPAKCLGEGSRKCVLPKVDRDTRTRQGTAAWQCTPSAKGATCFLHERLSVHGHNVSSLSVLCHRDFRVSPVGSRPSLRILVCCCVTKPCPTTPRFPPTMRRV